jgi:hypothetical protein
MATSYTSFLGLALPATGELNGTWGDVVDNYLTTFVDSAVAGAQTISGTQTAVTLSITNGTALTQAGAAGTTGSSQYQIINCTGNPAGTLTITAPASSKTYIIINGTSTSQSVKIVGAGPTTGVTVASGQRALVAWNGSDFVQVGASAGGSTTQVQYNSSGALAGSANMTFDGTKLTVAGLKDSALTSGRVTYATTSGELIDSANLTFSGTTLTANTLNLTNALGVAYGGTGLTSTPSNGQLDIGNGTGFTRATLTAGTGISITNGAGSVTIATSGSSGTSIGLVRAISINCILP